VNGNQELTYAVDFRAGRQDRQKNKVSSSHLQPPEGEGSSRSIPRIARLMALALRFEGLLRKETLRDYAELARLGGVTRARITQIMKLLDLAPDIQEQLLFLAPIKGLTERNLRPIVSRIDWREQRRLFQKLDKQQKIDLPVGRTRAIHVMYPAEPGPEKRTPTMNAFTIDSDNNIAVHATLKAARETGAGVFDTAENLAELIGADNQRLVEIWNGLTGVVPVKKFASRAIAARRIFAEVQKLAPPAADAR
jgi:hypothetical protein